MSVNGKVDTLGKGNKTPPAAKGKGPKKRKERVKRR